MKRKKSNIDTGDNMKKTMILGCIFISIGFILGNKTWKKITIPQKYYFIQEEIYDTNNNLGKENESIRKKGLEYKKDETHVYLGITKDITIANRIIELFKEKDQSLQIEEMWLDNEELSVNIEQLDLLVKKVNTSEEVSKIEEVALACYEETTKRRE